MVARRRLLPPNRLLDLGLVFQVVAAFDIAATRAWTGALASAAWYGLLPSECVLIVAYPLVVPNTPGKVLLASLLAASMGPATVVVSAALGGTVLERPAVFATYFLVSTYACAIAAYVGSRVVHRVGMRLKQARAIGSYELVEKIGEGGMGEVWRAKHRLLVRPAAIKLIRADVLGTSQGGDTEAVRRFEREAQDTAALRSVHTIDVYDFGITEDGDFYYVMELLDGISLERFVQTYGPMEPARVVYVLRQVCHSLAEAHARGLVHRDIKPANIFLCRLGPDDDFVKVLDFGLVKHAAPAATATQLTVAGIAAGTPAFMAPEVALAIRRSMAAPTSTRWAAWRTTCSRGSSCSLPIRRLRWRSPMSTISLHRPAHVRHSRFPPASTHSFCSAWRRTRRSGRPRQSTWRIGWREPSPRTPGLPTRHMRGGTSTGLQRAPGLQPRCSAGQARVWTRTAAVLASPGFGRGAPPDRASISSPAGVRGDCWPIRACWRPPSPAHGSIPLEPAAQPRAVCGFPHMNPPCRSSRAVSKPSLGVQLSGSGYDRPLWHRCCGLDRRGHESSYPE